MNTATISPALDVLANKPASAQTSKTPEADNNSQSFADVLSHQHTSQASETGKRVEKDPSTPKDSSHPDARSNDDPANSELARLTAQSGITGSSGLPLISNLAGQTTLMHEGLRSQAAQLKEPGLAMANNNRQALASTALQTTVVDTNSTAPRATALPASTNDNGAALANPIRTTANSHDRNADTTRLHQTLTAATKAKPQTPALNNAVLTTDTAKAGTDYFAGKIAVNEFSTAMIDAANLARGRLSDHNLPNAALGNTSDSIANLASQLLPLGSSGSPGTAVALNIPVPLSNPQWGADFGRQFVSLLQSGTNGPQIAELRLDPPELGPLRITLNLNDNTAHAAFFSPHAAVRQTVENALPQLQELLAQAGISLGETSVNDQNQTAQDFGNSNDNQSQASGRGSLTSEGLRIAENDSTPAIRNRAPDALVDTFA